MEAGDGEGKRNVHQNQREQNSWNDNIQRCGVNIQKMKNDEADVVTQNLRSERNKRIGNTVSSTRAFLTNLWMERKAYSYSFYHDVSAKKTEIQRVEQ